MRKERRRRPGAAVARIFVPERNLCHEERRFTGAPGQAFMLLNWRSPPELRESYMATTNVALGQWSRLGFHSNVRARIVGTGGFKPAPPVPGRNLGHHRWNDPRQVTH